MVSAASTSAFQADGAGSNPATCSKQFLLLCNQVQIILKGDFLMKVTLDGLYSDPAENLALLEHLFQISQQQKTLFVLTIGSCNYTFPNGTEREHRTKRFHEIIKKHKPP